MSQDGVNKARRRFLIGSTSVVGAVGAGFVAVPFIQSWQPSARAQAVGAPVEANINTIKPGQLVKFQWRGQTIGVMRRTQAMLDRLAELDSRLKDPDSENSGQQPDYAKNAHRSQDPEILVLNMHCTHLGCVPQVLPQPGSYSWEADWPGGFYCPCHKSKFDLAGRVFKSVPAPSNLLVPPHSFLLNDTLLIGVDPEGAA
jgi:ubiquinol-cytochrome c reductase iron-sulfur subunit